MAEYLYNIISSNKNIKYSAAHIKSWADEIRKLSELNNIPKDRIKKALRWYKQNIGGEYIPIVESGYSLRMKFLKLEAAREREGNGFNKSNDDEYRNEKIDLSKNVASVGGNEW